MVPFRFEQAEKQRAWLSMHCDSTYSGYWDGARRSKESSKRKLFSRLILWYARHRPVRALNHKSIRMGCLETSEPSLVTPCLYPLRRRHSPSRPRLHGATLPTWLKMLFGSLLVGYRARSREGTRPLRLTILLRTTTSITRAMAMVDLPAATEVGLTRTKLRTKLHRNGLSTGFLLEVTRRDLIPRRDTITSRIHHSSSLGVNPQVPTLTEAPSGRSSRTSHPLINHKRQPLEATRRLRLWTRTLLLKLNRCTALRPRQRTDHRCRPQTHRLIDASLI